MNDKNGKIISISSVKGGVGKTILALNLAGIYSMMKKKVLVIDFDLYSGGIAVCLDIKNKKDIFMMIDSLSNNRFTTLSDYIVSYNKNIDIISSPKDPRQALKIDSKYIPVILDMASKEYDVVIVDTNHILDEVNLTIMDYANKNLFVITNDLVDLKNMKSIISIFKDAQKTNYAICLNNSRDTGRDYLSLFDIRNILKTNINYTISKSFYIKNIDKYILNGEILTLNKNIIRFHNNDINKLRQMASELIADNGSDDK